MRLLFQCAHWHGLAKLRMHTDVTLEIMDRLTSELGKTFRDFKKKLCSAYQTQELPREENHRKNQSAKKAKAASANEVVDEAVSGNLPSVQKGRFGRPAPDIPADGKAQPPPRQKDFSLKTYKHHSLGDYVDTIRKYGTTDSYNTELVSVKLFSEPFRVKIFSPGRTGTSVSKSQISAY